MYGFFANRSVVLQTLFRFLCRDLLHRLAAALDAAVRAGAIDQYLDHSAALFTYYDLIHFSTPLIIKSLEKADNLIYRIRIAIFQIPRHARTQMIFQNVR